MYIGDGHALSDSDDHWGKGTNAARDKSVGTAKKRKHWRATRLVGLDKETDMEGKVERGQRLVVRTLVCCLLAVVLGALCSLAASGSSRPKTGALRPLVGGQESHLPETTRREDEVAVQSEGSEFLNVGQQVTQTWQLSTHAGGAVQAVEAITDYAFAGVGPRLVVFDVSSPSEPTITWQSPVFPGGTVDVAISGNHASVSYSNYERDGGLVVYDISDAAEPVELAHYVISEQVYEIDTAGQVVFACSEGALSVFDTTDSHRQAAARYTEWQCHDIKVVEQYAYVAAGGQGLYILDISDPVSPIQKGATSVDAYAYDVDVSGSFAYLINSTGTLSIVDTSVVTSPVPIPSYDNSRSIRDIVVNGGYAYIAGSYVLDVSDPYNPVPEETLILGSALSIAGSRLYVASGTYDPGLVVHDISQPSSTSELGHYDTAGRVLDLVRSDNLLYVADSAAGVRAFDMSNPDRPVETASLDPGYVERLAVADGYVFAAGDGLHVLDGLSLEEVSPPVSDAANDVVVDEDRPYAYLATELGLEIVDISDPRSIEIAGSYPGITGQSVTVSGPHAFVAAGYGGLHIIDVSESVTPTLVSSFDMDYASSVAVDGNIAYVVDRNSVQVLDVSNREYPVQLTSYSLMNAEEVALHGDLAYVNVTRGDLTVLDVSDPVDPRQIGFYATANTGWAGTPHANVRVVDGYVYLADSFSGFYILGRCGSEFLCVSGHTRDGVGTPISGVAVSAGTGGSATTGPTGAYTITNLVTGTYTLIPAKSGWTFTPSARTVSVPPDATGQDFTGSSTAPAVLAISHIEVTQAIQDEGNNVTLIADKPTFIRVYVDCGEGCGSPKDVTGILRGYGAYGELEDSPLSPVNPSITAYHPDHWTEQRGDLGKTLNFTLPRTWRSGTITLTAEVAGVQDSRAVTFHDARALNVRYVPIRDGSEEPGTDCVYNAPGLARKLYPTSELNYLPVPTWTWRRLGSCRAKWPFPFDQDEYQQCLQHDLLRQLDELYLDLEFGDYIFGWLPGGSTALAPELLGSSLMGVGKAAFGVCSTERGDWGEANYLHPQKILVHEVGHLLGRRHTNTADNTNHSDECAVRDGNAPADYEGTDDEWRAYVDPKSDWRKDDSTIQDFGLDGRSFGWLTSSSTAVKKPDDTYDYMSYCGRLMSDTVWTSAWTYNHIYSETLSAETSILGAQTSSARQAYLLTSGLVFTDDTASLATAWVVTATLPPQNPSAGTQYCLEAQDISATGLVSRCVDLDFYSYEAGEASAVDSFNLALPYPSGLARIVLKKGDQELVARTATANAPAVSVLSPNGGQTWSATSTYTITWAANDADGDALTHRVFYSPDGSNWIPVGSAITETHLAVNAAELPGGDPASVRVMASDGINTTVDESDTAFSVGDKAPDVHILAPEGDGTVPPETPILLLGYAYDLEDGVLGEAAYQWGSNRDGNLGAESESLITLSTGDHVITLAVTDSDGKTGTATVRVSVGHQVYLPLVLRE